MSIRRTFKAASYLTVGLLVARAFNFIQYAILANVLSQQALGDYAFSYTLSMLLASFSAMGIAAAVIREGAREGTREAEFILTGIPTRLVVSLIAMAVGVSMALMLPWRTELRYAVSLFAVTSVAISLAQLNEHILILHDRAGVATVCQVVMGAAQLALVGLVLLLGGGVIAASACVMVARVGLWLATHRLVLQRMPRPRPKPTWATCRRILAIGWPVGLHGILTSLYSRLDIVMLSGFKGNVEVAIYSTAMALINMAAMMQQPVNKALLPFLTREHKKDPESLLKAHETSVKMFAVVGLPGCVLGMLLLPIAIPMVYGSRYWASGLPAQVLVWTLPVRYISLFTVFVMLVGGAQRLSPIGVAAGAIMNWTLNLIFIPQYGYLGAAVAGAASHLTTFFVLMYLSERFLHRARWVRALAKPMIAAALMMVAAAALSAAGPVPQAAGSLLVFVVVFFALRPFSREEVRMFRKALGLKPRTPEP